MAAHGNRDCFLCHLIFQISSMNEMYGYEVGDRILHDFAIALQEKCQNGVLFCRVTSDHFVGVLEGRYGGEGQRQISGIHQYFCAEDQQPLRPVQSGHCHGMYEILRMTGRCLP